jgi:hypothetical protein
MTGQVAMKIRLLSQVSGTPARKLWEAGGDNSVQTVRWSLKRRTTLTTLVIDVNINAYATDIAR